MCGVFFVFVFPGDVFIRLSCCVTLIRATVTCTGTVWDVHCLRDPCQRRPVDIVSFAWSTPVFIFESWHDRMIF